MAKIRGLEQVVLRNAFYRDGRQRIRLAILLLLLVNLVLGATLAYRYLNPPKPQYFPTTAAGVMITIHPLTDPVVTKSFVLQWAANKVRKVFSLDYIHWREQLQEASSAFTTGGWQNFLDSLKKSNNLKTLTSLKMVSNAKITGSPRVTMTGVVSGHYAWKINMPILITFQNAKRTIPLPLDVTLIVLRMPVQKYPDRIAINNFLPVPVKKNGQAGVTGR